MRVLVTGATGTIGQALVQRLSRRGDQILALSRDPDRGRDTLGEGIEVHRWEEPTKVPPPRAALHRADAIVHLLGEPIAQRWSAETKGRIRDSRVQSTRMVVQGLTELTAAERPRALISQSATGYYGPSDERELAEDAPPGEDFLAQVTVEWEREAARAAELTRVVMTRTGVVLSPRGGALAQMLPFFRLGLGGPVAGGAQYVPWIHLDDVVGAMVHCLDHESLSGPVNVTAPNPVTNGELAKALGRALHRPAVLPVPAAGVRVLYGEMAQIVITGQRVLARRLQHAGYQFAYGELDRALAEVLGDR